MSTRLRTRLCPQCFRITWRPAGICSLCEKGAVTDA
jgi:hypothetical protein